GRPCSAHLGDASPPIASAPPHRAVVFSAARKAHQSTQASAYGAQRVALRQGAHRTPLAVFAGSKPRTQRSSRGRSSPSSLDKRRGACRRACRDEKALRGENTRLGSRERRRPERVRESHKGSRSSALHTSSRRVPFEEDRARSLPRPRPPSFLCFPEEAPGVHRRTFQRSSPPQYPVNRTAAKQGREPPFG